MSRSHQLTKTVACVILGLAMIATASPGSAANIDARTALRKIGFDSGVVAVLGLPESDRTSFVTDLASNSRLLVFFQSPDASEVLAVRKAAESAGLLGKQVFVEQSDWERIHLASNLAGAVLCSPSAAKAVKTDELLRILHPDGKAFKGDNDAIVKPFPKDIDFWSHAYHGPDNNPLSTDQRATAPYRTQFLANPKFSPMPEQSVAAGGRIFKAFGHIAHKANQNAVLNTLMGVNAYNGAELWRRELPKGFMIHRNTMIATADALYMGDDESCKIFDALTGKIRDEIVIPDKLADGPVWKWMAMQDGILYALIGNHEVKVDTRKSDRRGLGHWPWGMWKGHNYADPSTSFGFGRTLVAIDTKTKKILWDYSGEDYIDSRALCLRNGRIYFFSPLSYLGCLDAANGTVVWQNADRDLLEAIGADGRAQHYITGYATTCFMKCNDNFLLFAGPQRKKLVAASTTDGRLVWTRDGGNLQLILREEALYCAGAQNAGNNAGLKLDYETGDELGRMPTRRACTRATGSIDSIFFRTSGGTVRFDIASNTAQHIAPMRPPCQDGVIISNGNLYWGPWMCGCQLSLYGHICLTSAKSEIPLESDDFRLQQGKGDFKTVTEFPIAEHDWSSYRGNNERTSATKVEIPEKIKLQWKHQIKSGSLPTAPVVAGGTIFIADRSGVVRALDTNGKLRWKSYTGGAVYYPPAVSEGRVYVGSADGCVYAFEATTGRELWSFQVGPAVRRIPVYGKLISTWPVAGGVVVDGPNVYAAAGIAHYDGTHVVTLDAVTGELKTQNKTSGSLSEKVNSGVSLQGNLCLEDGQLCFLAGGVYETARYDCASLNCLNSPRESVTSQFRTAFYPYYPEYGNFVSIEHTFVDGRTLEHDASYEGSRFSDLSFLEPPPPDAPKTKKLKSRWFRRKGKKFKRDIVWKDKTKRRFTSFIVAPNVLLSAGQPDNQPNKPFLAATTIKDGKDVWYESLPSNAVKGGTAIDHNGRIIVALVDGQVLCFASSE